MFVEIVRRSLIGLGFTALITFAFLTVMKIQEMQVPVSVIWENMFGSVLMGIYFGVSSLIFEVEKWSPLKQTITHFFLSIFIWLPIGLWMGWVPVDGLAILLGIGFFTLVYVVFWISAYFYFRRMTNDMNKWIKK